MLTDEQKTIFEQVRIELGAPVVPVQLTDDQLCALFDLVVNDYQSQTVKFITLNNWAQIYGRNYLSTNDMAWATMTRNFDYAKQFSYFFSSQVGLQQQGNGYELKKDYFMIERGKQDYVVPAGRLINSVLYITPPTTPQSIMAAGGGVAGFGGAGMPGFAQVGGYGGLGGGTLGLWAFPAYDIALLSSDLKYKQKLFGGELVYNVTALETGEHVIHLLSTPGSKFNFFQSGWGGGFLGGIGCHCWYTYYDATHDNEVDCALKNSTVLISPDQYRLTPQTYSLMNVYAQQQIKRMLIAKAKMTLGYIRGYASGSVDIPNAKMTLDYSMFLNDGRSEYKEILSEIDKFLDKLSPVNQLKNQADMTESLQKILAAVPMKIYYY
jgi:hypothetical protein